MTPRSIADLFNTMQNMKGFKVKLRATMIELAGDRMRDLLIENRGAKMDIRDHASGLIDVIGATEREINNITDAENAFEGGLNKRAAKGTHIFFTIKIESYNSQTKQKTLGRMTFVELASTDRGKEDDAGKSYVALKEVMDALTKEKDDYTNIPYRLHPLTKLLKDCLGGTSKTLFILNLSPSANNDFESKKTFEFGV